MPLCAITVEIGDFTLGVLSGVTLTLAGAVLNHQLAERRARNDDRRAVATELVDVLAELLPLLDMEPEMHPQATGGADPVYRVKRRVESLTRRAVWRASIAGLDSVSSGLQDGLASWEQSAAVAWDSSGSSAEACAWSMRHWELFRESTEHAVDEATKLVVDGAHGA